MNWECKWESLSETWVTQSPEVLLLVSAWSFQLLVLILFVAPLPWHRSVISASKAEFLVASRWNELCMPTYFPVFWPPPPTFSLELGVAGERNGFWTWNQTERNWTGTGRRGCVSFCFPFVNSKASRCSRQSSDSEDQQHVPRGCPEWGASADASQKAMTQWAFCLSWRHWHAPRVPEGQTEGWSQHTKNRAVLTYTGVLY